jgi:hypothetical protein
LKLAAQQKKMIKTLNMHIERNKMQLISCPIIESDGTWAEKHI